MIVITLAALAAACDGGVSGRAAPAMSASVTPAAATTTATRTGAPTTGRPRTTAAERADAAPATTGRLTAVPAPSTTAAPTVPPTTVAGADAVGRTCGVLAGGTWEERRGAILTGTAGYVAEGGVGPLVDAVRAACPDDLARQEAAAALEQRAFAVGAALDGTVTPTWRSCAAGRMEVSITVDSTELVGAVVAAHPDDDFATDDRHALAAFADVFWHVAPNARLFTLPITGDACVSFAFSLFVADDSPVDTALPGGDGPPATGEEPADWLLALLQRAGPATEPAPPSPTLDAVADVRAILFGPRWPGEVPTTPRPPDVHPAVAARVCDGTVDHLDADHVAFAYVVEFAARPDGDADHPAYDELDYGAFRRGSDGRWRSLAHPIMLDGTITASNCAPTHPHP